MNRPGKPHGSDRVESGSGPNLTGSVSNPVGRFSNVTGRVGSSRITLTRPGPQEMTRPVKALPLISLGLGESVLGRDQKTTIAIGSGVWQ